MNEPKKRKKSLDIEEVEEQIAAVRYYHVGVKTTVCLLTLKNGYEVIGTSSCVDPANYDQGVGEDLSYKRAMVKVWELEGYRLQEKLSGIRV